ncbi:MAG: glycosyltransferase family 1 protein [Bacteroides sp.]|nr:glycosyltransferase family 1 protein [Bacteroides sp.]
MKAVFLIFHGFEEFNGISKKIRYQVKALTDIGVDVRTCYLTDEDNRKCRMIDDQILENYGDGIKGKIRKRTGLGCIVKYALQENIDFFYIRSDHNTTPFLIHMLRRLHRHGIRTALEIPTYPYDQEYKGLSFAYQRVLFMDKCLRGIMARYIDKIVTFSDHEKIFGRPTIRISNGIDFDAIPLRKQKPSQKKDEIHLIAVATIHPWHGFDRAIAGVAAYYRSAPRTPVYLHIVGQGVPQVTDAYHRMVAENQIEDYVIFHGPLYGEQLDAVFNRSNLGIGSLARHRSGITHIKTLKNREYAARGIPFIYSETDEDFEQAPYILKIPPTEDPLDIEAVLQFYRNVRMTPAEIRQSIENTLTWKVQMQQVVNELWNEN